VGLTEEKIKDLQDKKFDELFTKNIKEWSEMASNAHSVARAYITKGAEPRPDDVLKMLLPMLEPHETLRKHQEKVHAKYSRYRVAFGEYIIDQILFKKEEKQS
jgi:hypothetical protein